MTDWSLRSGAAIRGPLGEELLGQLDRNDCVRPSTRIGAYRVVSEIGRGGMAVVCRAERADGAFEQQVALKLIKRGLDTDEIVARFRRERQILASLTHPGIARLLDGGITSDGRPYFAMELVRGEPIDRFCRRHRLSVDGRLRLALAVANAVQHAHRRLVIHRDLKPSNILVTADGDVKLLDFGIAKLLDPGQIGDDLATRVRALTPRYAAPEQFTGEPTTTATDVYGLGVVVYELLTGKHPYGTVSEGELLSAMLERSPLPPSVALGADGDTASEQLGVSRRPFQRRLKGDLDTIILAALRKEPERRYQSIDAFAQDLGRFLKHEPVSARPDSRLYRMHRFARRHIIGVLSVLTIVVLLVAGVAGTVWQARLASAQARRAEAAQTFLASVFRVSSPNESKGRTITAREVLELGVRRVDAELAAAPDVQADMLTLLGRIYTQLGLFSDARPLLDRAVAAQERTQGRNHLRVAEALEALGALKTRQGQYREAERTLRAALSMFASRPGQADSNVIAVLNQLADVHMQTSEFELAEEEAQKALTIARGLHDTSDPVVAESLSLLALAHRARGRLEQGAAMDREALALRREHFGTDHPDVVLNLASVALAEFDLGNYEAAERLYREALDASTKTLGPEHPDTLQRGTELATVIGQRGRFQEAVDMLQARLAVRRRVLGDSHPNLVPHLNALAANLRRLDRLEEATPLYREALAITERQLGPDHLEAAKNLNDLGGLLIETGAPSEAEPLLRRCLSILEKRLGPDHSYVGRASTSLGQSLFALGQWQEAEDVLRRALVINRATLPEGHSLTADAAFGLGRALLRTPRTTGEAEPLLHEALAIRTTLYGVSDLRTAEAALTLGEHLLDTGRAHEASPLLRQAHDAFESLKGTHDPTTRRALKALRLAEPVPQGRR